MMNTFVRLSRILLFVFVFELFFPLIGSIGITPTYAYIHENASLKSGTNSIALENKNSSFTVQISSPENFSDETDMQVRISDGAHTKTAFLDLEWEESETHEYFTAPLHFESTKNITISLIPKNPNAIFTGKLIALNTNTSGFSISWNPKQLEIHAADDPKIISRKEWWADETLRYKDAPVWKDYYEKEKTHIPTASEKSYNARIKSIRSHLEAVNPEEFTMSEVIRKEGGHDLVWPIEKTEYVRKIVLHHTAENNLKDLSDEELLRSMYYYHAITRGWGDIGYNYIVGQRGTIYEWRAGGDYAIWAHAAWNNASTVWVSAIGNFELYNVNKDQEAGINTILSFLVKKYGINTSKELSGHRECKTDSNCLTNDFLTSGLAWHRDVGYTSCPGANLYAKITSFKTITDAIGKWLSYKKNPIYKPETLQNSDNDSTSISLGSSTVKTLSKWPMIRVKLSIPEMKEITLESVSGSEKELTFNTTVGKTSEKTFKIKSGLGENLVLTLWKKRYTGKIIAMKSDVVKIANWDHVPGWDTKKTYNDNLFRGKIEVRKEGKNIIVINELPLEDYLKGIAEVSNGDNEEKMKTILVAARSYAYWYSQKENRKFPGKPYDGSDDPEIFQKYLGYGYELRSPATKKLVDATNGILITHNGSPIKPWYFNDSNGRTLSAKEYCEINGGKNCVDIPYLQSVSDPGAIGHTRKWHGVGISGVGATYFATEKGYTYDTIIKYYLTWVDVKKWY